jgi:hypothetical protein
MDEPLTTTELSAELTSRIPEIFNKNIMIPPIIMYEERGFKLKITICDDQIDCSLELTLRNCDLAYFKWYDRDITDMVKTIRLSVLQSLSDELGKIFDHRTYTMCPNCNRSCCKSCGHSRGFFGFSIFGSRFEIADTTLIELAYQFNANYGYFDTINGGCRLPRQIRSLTCLQYYCDKMDLSREERIKVYNITSMIAKIRKKLNLPC